MCSSDLLHINWNDLDINKLLNNKYTKIIENNPEKTLKELKSFLTQEKNNNSLHKYCIIISETKDNLDYQYRIKGIVEEDYLGLKVVLNNPKEHISKKIKK